MPLVLLVVAIAVLAVFAYRARPSAATWTRGNPPSADVDDGDGATGAPASMTADERVEIGSIIDDWVEVSTTAAVEKKRAGELAVITRCETMLATLDRFASDPDVDAAAAALRSILSMALFNQERYDECIDVLRHQLVPLSLVEPAQRSVHPLPLLARALAARGDGLEALAVLEADEQLDDRRDPASVPLAVAERSRLRAAIEAGDDT